MATLATANEYGNARIYEGGTGVNDNDVVINTDDVSNFREFTIMTTAGAVDVFPSVDGTNYATAPLSLVDLGATTTAPVVVTAANRIYAFYGVFRKIKVQQNGATAATDVTLACAPRSM